MMKRITMGKLLWFWVVIFDVNNILLVDAQWRGMECKLSKQPIVLLRKEANSTFSNNFTIVETLSADTDLDMLTDGSMRFLQDQNLNEIEEAQQSDTTTEDELLYYARVCDCFSPRFPTVYCPLTVSTCQRPSFRSGLDEPGCLNIPKGREQVKSIYMIPLVWFVLLIAFTLLTKFGWSTVDFMISCCFPKWNRFVANRMLRRDPNRALALIRNNLRRRHRWLERRADHLAAQSEAEAAQVVIDRENNPLENEPSSLLLKTRTFRTELPKRRPSSSRSNKSVDDTSHHETTDDHQDDTSCTICFAPILDGERIGALQCDHCFHVDCLKSWLPRRNTCPLCQRADIATPQFDKAEEENEVALTEPIRSFSNLSSMQSASSERMH